MSGNVMFKKGMLKAEREKRLEGVRKEQQKENLKSIRIRKQPNKGFIAKNVLENFYLIQKKSIQDISNILGYSRHKVDYWMLKYNIPVRNQSEASYVKHNPKGDPFKSKNIKTIEDSFLFGLGLGLFWGEGNKANKHAVRLGNSDPAVIKKFIEFLEKIYGVERKALRFGVQIFNDLKPQEILSFWAGSLNVSKDQFQKLIITKSRGKGTYKKKSRYGVLTVYFHNKKLRDVLIAELVRLGLKV